MIRKNCSNVCGKKTTCVVLHGVKDKEMDSHLHDNNLEVPQCCMPCAKEIVAANRVEYFEILTTVDAQKYATIVKHGSSY